MDDVATRPADSLYERDSTPGRGSFAKAYAVARKLAAAETGRPLSTFPVAPPFTHAQAVDQAFVPRPPAD